MNTNIEIQITEQLATVSVEGAVKETTVAVTEKGVPGKGMPPGGTTSQVITKRSDADLDADWYSLSGVAWTGEYSDLKNTPEIPVVPNKLSSVDALAGMSTEPHTIDANTLKEAIIHHSPETVYSAGNGIKLVGKTFSQEVETEGAGTFLSKVQQTTDGIKFTYDTPQDKIYPIASSATDGLMSKEDKQKLETIAYYANDYTHPANHSPSIILQDKDNRFVTDAEKTAWGNKWDYDENTIKGVKVNNASDADKVNGKEVKSDVPENAVFTDTKYGEGTNITIDENNKINATDTTYSVFDDKDNGLVPKTEANPSGGKYLADDGSWKEVSSSTNYSKATSTSLGVVKLGSDVEQTEAAQTPSSTTGRTYPIQLNANDQAVVNVPWEAGSGGGSGKEYTAGNGLTLANDEFSIGSEVVGTGTFISGVEITSSGLKITKDTPPDTDTNTTYDIFDDENNGLVPKTESEPQGTKYLNDKGQWTTPPDTNTTYNVFDENDDGLVPKTEEDPQGDKYLANDGTWKEIEGGGGEGGSIGLVTHTKNGLMSFTDKIRLDNLFGEYVPGMLDVRISYSQTQDRWLEKNMSGPIDLHKSLKRCMVDPSTGTVNYYLNEYNSNFKEDGETPAVFDGSDGICMVEIGLKGYTRTTWDGEIVTYEMSSMQHPGFTLHPSFENCDKWYLGAFDATVMRPDGSIVDGLNYDNNLSRVDLANDKLISLPNDYAMCGLTRAEFRTLAQNNNLQLIDFWQWNYIQLLLLTEYSTWNLQDAVGDGNVHYSSWPINSGNRNDSRVSINGLSMSLGNLTGGVSTAGGNKTTDFMSYRGIENFWGNIWQWVDGFNANNRDAYICNDPSKFADDTSTNYVQLGSKMPTSNGFIKSIQKLETAILPATLEGNSDEYMTDYYWQNSEWRVARAGALALDGLRAGPFALDVGNDSGSRHRASSSRVSLKITI